MAETDTDISPTEAAKLLGSLGGIKGGPARAKKLSAARRLEIAETANKARWKGHTPKRKK